MMVLYINPEKRISNQLGLEARSRRWLTGGNICLVARKIRDDQNRGPHVRRDGTEHLREENGARMMRQTIRNIYTG